MVATAIRKASSACFAGNAPARINSFANSYAWSEVSGSGSVFQPFKPLLSSLRITRPATL